MRIGSCNCAPCLTVINTFDDVNVTLWGQVGTTSGITIGTKAVIMGQTGVTKSVDGGKTYFGTPIEESREKLKQLANVKRIPEIIEKLKQNDK